MHRQNVRIVLEDGTVFRGKSFALSGDRYVELVFNTAMTGYQEVLTDPSYAGQAVVFTYPMIGNYGVNEEDFESKKTYVDALIVKEYVDHPSSWRHTKSLKMFLEENGTFGVEGVDTRALTRHIRMRGSLKAAITTCKEPAEVITSRLRDLNVNHSFNLSRFASCDRSYTWRKPTIVENKVAVIDCGIKRNILELLFEQGCDSTVFNSTVHVDRILEGGFDGVLISNGPGDPQPVYHVSEMVKNLLGKIPVFGICLGHQILSLALGAKTYKLKFGHRGVNHPVKNLRTSKIEITSQNHSFAVSEDGLPDDVEVTHINLNDQTVAGLRHKKFPAFSVQYHPEASPGPRESRYLFDDFSEMMNRFKRGKAHPEFRFHERLKLFVRQSYTEASGREQDIVQGVLDVIQKLDKNPHSLDLLTGARAHNQDDFQKGFESRFNKRFTTVNFRQTRLNLLKRSDAIVVIRTGLSESTAFEVAFNIFGGKKIPMFFAIHEDSKMKDTLLRDLDDMIDVSYMIFKYPHELQSSLTEFFNYTASGIQKKNS